MRQNHVKEDPTNPQSDKRSPVLKTFAEAKQNLPDQYDMQSGYDNQISYDMQNSYNNEYSNLNATFAEADETNYLEENYDSYGAEQQKYEYEGACSQPQVIEPDGITSYPIRSNEGIGIESLTDEYGAIRKDRFKRRKSRELPAEPDISKVIQEEPKRKPETMRSVSEESAPRVLMVVTRRSLSHPEKESPSKGSIKDSPPTKIPNPKPLSELGDQQKKLTPRRKAKTVDVESKKNDDDDDDEAVKIDPITNRPKYRFQRMLEKRGDSKSFDAVVNQAIRNEKGGDEKSQSLDDNLFSEKKEVIKKRNNCFQVFFQLEIYFILFFLEQHKSTLNEAEIQCAVEAAAGLFKKVVLQKRKEKKASDDGECFLFLVFKFGDR